MAKFYCLILSRYFFLSANFGKYSVFSFILIFFSFCVNAQQKEDFLRNDFSASVIDTNVEKSSVVEGFHVSGGAQIIVSETEVAASISIDKKKERVLASGKSNRKFSSSNDSETKKPKIQYQLAPNIKKVYSLPTSSSALLAGNTFGSSNATVVFPFTINGVVVTKFDLQHYLTQKKTGKANSDIPQWFIAKYDFSLAVRPPPNS